MHILKSLSVSSSVNELILGQVTNLRQISELVFCSPNLYHRSEIFQLSYGSRQNRLMKILEFMVGVKKGSCCKVLQKKKYFFRYLSERENLALYQFMKVEFEPSKVIFSTLPGKLHIVAEMVSKVQRDKEFWMLFGIMSEEQKLCSPI